MASLVVELAGLELRNPILSASGTFGHGLEMRHMTPPSSVGGLVSKSVSLLPRAGNAQPRICETEAGFLNSIGLENRGLDSYVANILPDMLDADTLVFTNVAAESIEDFAAVARRLDGEPAVDALEINLSCPNVQGGRLPFSTDAEVAERVIRGVRDVTTKPIFAKLSPNVTRIADIAIACEAGGANGITAVNTLLGMRIDWRTGKTGLATGMGGYSGTGVKPVALRCAWECAQAVSVPVIGCGGIATADDVLEFMAAGCAAVQVGTAAFADPGLPGRLPGEVARLLDAAGIGDIRNVIGNVRYVGSAPKPSSGVCP